MLASTTNLDQCYQLLGIDRGASIEQLKAAYRSLARKWHPDLNPDNLEAHQRFITIDRAYRILLDRIQTHSIQPSTTVRVTYPAAPQPAATPKPSKSEEVKWQIYHQLQSLLKQKQFLNAIVLVENLARHTPQDLQVCQWQGIIYSQYANQLSQRREFDKARIYLKKALKVDPHNRQLWQEIDRAFNRITRLS